MKLRDRLRASARVFAQSSSWPNISLDEFARQMDDAFNGAQTRSGVRISTETAMQISAVFCAVNLISGSLASCRLILYQRTGEWSRERFRDHPLYAILHDQVNPQMTAYNWKRTSAAHLCFWGNAYSRKLLDRYRGIYGLEILHPSQVRVFKSKLTDELLYEVKLTAGKDPVILTRSEIFHVPGLGFNGITGFSIISLARESLGLASAMEEYGQRYFGQGVNAGGYLEHPGNLGKEAQTRLVESIEERNAGVGKAHKLFVLEEGMKFNKATMPLEDAQFLTSRTFQIQEIARWFNTPPHKLKELSRSTFSNIEHQQIEYLTDTIHPWAELIESEINLQLIEPGLRESIFAEFSLDSLLRGDAVSRNNALAIKRQWGITSANEWRAHDNENPQSGDQGNKYLVPSNMIDAALVGKVPPAPTPPTPEPKPDEKKETPPEQSEDENPDDEISEEGIDEKD